ncbi:MAG: hypothetical protein JSU08_02980 [Acidobacteria bacterium]|nr:hypothetical protein [Acidobacteriota bacterium]
MDLLPLFQSFEGSGLGQAVRESVWAFAAIESIHLLALAMMGGAALLVDLRLLNLGMTERTTAELADEASPYFTLGLIVLMISGAGLFASEAVKCYYSTPFWVKIGTLVVATIFAYAVRNPVARAAEGRVGGGTRALVALASIALWFVVAAAGRWIGFSG